MKTKTISALILIAMTIPIIWLGGWPLKVFVSLLGVLAYKEIIDLKKGKNRYPLLLVVLGLFNFLNLVISGFISQINALSISSVSLAIMLLTMLIPVVIINNNDKYSSSDALFLTGSVLCLGLAFSTLYMIVDYNILFLVYLLLITVSTDTFAQFGGMLFGKHKLTKISPKKTWEGAIIGTIFGSAIPITFYMLAIGNAGFLSCLGITILLSIISQFGDLFFSAIKRLNNIKDYSNIIPGHGGILDRLDSLVFVLIAFAMLIAYL